MIFPLKIGYRNEKVMMDFTVGVRFATSFQAPNLGSQSRNHPNNKFLNDIKTLNPSKVSYDGQWEVLHCTLQVSSRTPKTGLLGTAFIQAL